MFNVNRHLNLTNVCTASCAYCSFQRKPGEKDAYTMRVEEAVAKAKEMEDEQLTELHIVNGLHPTLPWKYYPRVLRELKAALPEVSLKASPPPRSTGSRRSPACRADEILDELIDAGLESLTGGGAEIFDWEVRQHIVDHATHWEDWSRIHRLAHSKGLRTPATMLYGHIEEPRHRVDHVLRLRELQDETGGFAVFIPLRYQHDFVDSADGMIRNRLQARTTMAVAGRVAQDVRGVPAAVRQRAARQVLLGHARAVAWPSCRSTSASTTSTARSSSTRSRTTPTRTARPNTMHREDLLDLIWDAGFRPVERNTRYEVVREYDAPPHARRAPRRAAAGLGLSRPHPVARL